MWKKNSQGIITLAWTSQYFIKRSWVPDNMYKWKAQQGWARFFFRQQTGLHEKRGRGTDEKDGCMWRESMKPRMQPRCRWLPWRWERRRSRSGEVGPSQFITRFSTPARVVVVTSPLSVWVRPWNGRAIALFFLVPRSRTHSRRYLWKKWISAAENWMWSRLGGGRPAMRVV